MPIADDMGYGKEIYLEARSVLETRRRNAEALADEKRRYFHALCPRAEIIRQDKASGAAKIAKAVLTGENTKDALLRLKAQNLRLESEYQRLLSNHRLKKNDIEPQYSCSKCRDTGFIDGKMCICLKQLQKQMAYERLNRSLPLSGSTFESFSLDYYTGDTRKRMEQIFTYCKQYAVNFRSRSPSLLFRGATGLGKTHLSLAIACAATEKGFGVIYGSSQNFAVSLEKERFDRRNEDVDFNTNQKLQECDLLILDDLGTEFSSSYVTAALYTVIDTRLLASKPTIISTNLTHKEMELRYGARFVSRIAGNYGVFEFTGSDIRIQKRMKRNQKQ